MTMAKRRKPAPAAGSAVKPKFGSPAWNARYGIKRFAKGGKRVAAKKGGK